MLLKAHKPRGAWNICGSRSQCSYWSMGNDDPCL